MLRAFFAITASSLALALPLLAQEKSPPVTMKTVKYAGVAETVNQHRGKVVVVDLWQFG
jgi:hypothetical protein